MNVTGLERALEVASIPRRDRVARLRTDFDEQARRLEILDRVTRRIGLLTPCVTLLALEDSPLGTGVVAGNVIKMNVSEGRRFHADYFFIGPGHNYGDPRRIATEGFTDTFKSEGGWLHDAFRTMHEDGLADFIEPQLGRMQQTADIFETALHSPVLGNEELLRHYEEISADLAA